MPFFDVVINALFTVTDAIMALTDYNVKFFTIVSVAQGFQRINGQCIVIILLQNTVISISYLSIRLKSSMYSPDVKLMYI